jgi:hypothetical protein
LKYQLFMSPDSSITLAKVDFTFTKKQIALTSDTCVCSPAHLAICCCCCCCCILLFIEVPVTGFSSLLHIRVFLGGGSLFESFWRASVGTMSLHAISKLQEAISVLTYSNNINDAVSPVLQPIRKFLVCMVDHLQTVNDIPYRNPEMFVSSLFNIQDTVVSFADFLAEYFEPLRPVRRSLLCVGTETVGYILSFCSFEDFSPLLLTSKALYNMISPRLFMHSKIDLNKIVFFGGNDSFVDFDLHPLKKQAKDNLECIDSLKLKIEPYQSLEWKKTVFQIVHQMSKLSTISVSLEDVNVSPSVLDELISVERFRTVKTLELSCPALFVDSDAFLSILPKFESVTTVKLSLGMSNFTKNLTSTLALFSRVRNMEVTLRRGTTVFDSKDLKNLVFVRLQNASIDMMSLSVSKTVKRLELSKIRHLGDMISVQVLATTYPSLECLRLEEVILIPRSDSPTAISKFSALEHVVLICVEGLGFLSLLEEVHFVAPKLESLQRRCPTLAGAVAHCLGSIFSKAKINLVLCLRRKSTSTTSVSYKIKTYLLGIPETLRAPAWRG